MPNIIGNLIPLRLVVNRTQAAEMPFGAELPGKSEGAHLFLGPTDTAKSARSP
jgi:hypothetical protein